MRWMRITLVTMGLAAAGAVFGTLAGMVVLFAWLAILGGLGPVLNIPFFMAQIALVYGGGLGAVLGPLAAWTLMRRVPLWLAVGGTTLGTLAAGGLGLLLAPHPMSAILFGMVGFCYTAVRLRNRFAPDAQPSIGG